MGTVISRVATCVPFAMIPKNVLFPTEAVRLWPSFGSIGDGIDIAE